jgi:hypothetical protein
MTELAVHPVAALFPMLADDELEELAAGHQTPAPAWQDIKHLPLRGRTSNTCPCGTDWWEKSTCLHLSLSPSYFS